MLTRKATRPMIALWKRTWAEYRDQLKTDRKSGAEILAYLREHYPLEEFADESAKRVVLENARSVELPFGRLADGEALEAAAFLVRDESSGHVLYELQDGIFKGVPIFVGVERTTGFFHVEGSSRLWDELNAFRGGGRGGSREFLPRRGVCDQLAAVWPVGIRAALITKGGLRWNRRFS